MPSRPANGDSAQPLIRIITAVRRIVEVEEVGQVLARHQIMPECEVIVDPEVVNSESGLVLWVVLAGFRLKKRTLTSTACA